jgi:ergothioneine biosynthesis protein EgtB
MREETSMIPSGRRATEPRVDALFDPGLYGGSLLEAFRKVRAATELLCAPLAPEDCVVQSMDDASPTKWHLAHTSWFFEAFLLEPHGKDYAPFHPRYGYLFNSYYDAVGDRHARSRRGLLTRPSVDEIQAYRRHVDRHVGGLLKDLEDSGLGRPGEVVRLGLHHEQQHQELLLMDILHVFSCNPLRPAYAGGGGGDQASGDAPPLDWIPFPEGIRSIGNPGSGFCFDNETPRHKTYLEPFLLANRLVTNGEYSEFIEDGGYRRSELWLSDGWDAVRRGDWRAPLYWDGAGDGSWRIMSLRGMETMRRASPVANVSYYEADAYARWRGARLPTEAEWETASEDAPLDGNFLETSRLAPLPALSEGGPLRQMFGDLWEWTSSPYTAYPGYVPPAGALGEYNGKFMVNQFVLRGGSYLTPRSHIRRTYRNFFHPHSRWAASGIRLARDGRSL